ncbi:MAG: hypothetical protein K6L76_06715 [Agarilytica sp.]
MAMAPTATERGGSEAHITASYLDKDRLYLVFNIALDADLPPLPNDMAVIVRDERYNVISLDIQLQEDHSVVALLMEAPLAEDAAFVLQYRPSQWLMCDEATGDAIDAFDEEIIPQSVDLLDPSLRLKSDLDSKAPSSTAQSVASKEVEATITSASEYIIQLTFNAALDSSVPLEMTDFRAELEDRWLKITSAKYINSHRPNWPEIRLELSEPMEVHERVRVGYRSPSNRLRTLEAEIVASFDVETRVARTLGRNVSDDEAALETVAVSKAPQPTSQDDSQAVNQLEVSAEIASTNESDIDIGALSDENLPAAETHDPILDELDQIAEAMAENQDDNDEVVAIENVDDLEVLEQGDIAPNAAEENQEQGEEKAETADEQGNVDLVLDTANDTTVTAAISDEMLSESETLSSGQAQVEEISEHTEALGDHDDANAEEITNTQNPENTEGLDASASEENNESDASVESASGKSLGGKNLAATLGQLNSDAQEDKNSAPTVTLVKKTRAETIAEKAARIQKALESKSEIPEPKTPESLTARLIYIIPAVIFVWLLIVVFVYVSSIVFDLDFTSSSPEPVVVLPAGKMPKEQCSVKSEDGSSYQGECVSGKREGFGTYIWPTGNRYEGHWLAGKRHGKGKLVFSSGGQYQGDFRAGIEEGRGKMEWPNGAFYEGEYRNGKFHGKGVYKSASGSRYEGVFDGGNMTQNGVCILVSGERRQGPCSG